MIATIRGWWFAAGLAALTFGGGNLKAQITIIDGVINFPIIVATPGQVIPFFANCPGGYLLLEYAVYGGASEVGLGPITYVGGGANVQWQCWNRSATPYYLNFQEGICDCPGTSPSPKNSGNPSDAPGSCSCGDPINIGSGNVYEQVVDYQTTGQNPLSFIRYYNSVTAPHSSAVSLGWSWRTNYDRYLTFTATPTGPLQSVSAERADGQVLTFNLGTTWVSDSDVDLTLNSGPSYTWTITDSKDTIETYYGSPSTGTFTAHLISIQYRDGYKQTIAYNENNQVASVVDSYNRTLGLNYYSNGLLESVTTSDGLVLTYNYNASGINGANLDRMASVTYSTSPTTTQDYVYEDASFPVGLTGIIDEGGNRYATWTYDGQGRGLTSQHAGGADLITVAYNDSDGSRNVTNALGEQSLYKFSMLQNVPKLTEIDRQTTSTTAVATETFTYDSNGYLASQTDWNGNLTTYVNDSRGEPLTVTQASGTPQAVTTTTTYLSNYHLPSQIVTPGLTTNFTYDASGDLLAQTNQDTTTQTMPYATGGQTRTWNYTWQNFLLASSQSPNGNLTKYSYDATGALISTTNPFNQVTNIVSIL